MTGRYLLTYRDWQAQALKEANELCGTPEGAARLAEAKRYGALGDEIERLEALLAKHGLLNRNRELSAV